MPTIQQRNFIVTGQSPIAAPDWTKTVHFIGDTHVGAVSAGRLASLSTDINNLSAPVAHVQVGDTTDTATAGQDTDALAFLNGLPATWYSICGGHDVWGDARTPAQWATAYGMAGQSYVVDLTFCQLICIGVDNATSYTLSVATLAWLDAALTAAGATPCIIVNHHPLYNTVQTPDAAKYYASLANTWYQKDNAAVRQIVANHDNAVAWVAGHTHSPHFANQFIYSELVGTHYVAIISCSSPYYTNFLAGEDLTEAVISLHVSLPSASLMEVRVRDSLSARWIKRYNLNLATGQTEITPQLSDQFTSDHASGMTGIRTCEPGPGGLDITDTNSIISIAAGKLTFNGTPVSGNNYFAQPVLLRKCGRAFRFDVGDRTAIGITNYFGLAATPSQSADIGFTYPGVNTLAVRRYQTALYSASAWAANVHSFICAMRSAGGLLLGRDAADAENVWTVLYIYSRGAQDAGTGALYAQTRLQNAAQNFTEDNLWIGDLTGNFATDFGWASVYDAVTVDAQTAVGAAGGWFEHTITAQTGITQELMFRRQDDDNTWIVRMDQGASQVTLISKVAGVETVRGGPVAFTFTDGTKYRVLVYSSLTNTQRVWIDDVSATSGNNSALNSNTGIKVSHAGEHLAFWPLTITVP